MTVSVASTISTIDYNTIRDTIIQVLNSSTSGYGPFLVESSSATTSMVMISEHWTNLYNDINKCIVHQNGSSITNILLPQPGSLISATFVNSLISSATTAVTNKDLVHPSQLKTYLSTTNFIAVPWDSEVNISRTYTWDSILQAHYHFNLGGYVVSTINYAGSPSGTTDTSFASFVTAANASSEFLRPYNKSEWINYASTVTTFSDTTPSGIFTASVTYTANADGMTVLSTINPPAGISPINLIPISNSTLYSSTGTIGATLPNLVINRKFIEVDPLGIFTFQAGTRSNPQILKIKNVGAETITITGVSWTSNGVYGTVASTATDLSAEFPGVVALPPTITLAPGADYDAIVYYVTPNPVSEGQIGTYNNSITITSDAPTSALSIQTQQVVTAPSFSFNIYLIDAIKYYSYESWRIENNLTTAQKNRAIEIANRYYLSNTDFGVIRGRRRYGLFRKPDSDGLLRWLNYVDTYTGGNTSAIDDAFFSTVDAGSRDLSRSLTNLKSFDVGFGGGDFYDKTLSRDPITSGVPSQYPYGIIPRFGSIPRTADNPGYTASLSNFELNNTANQQAQNAFSLAIRNTEGAGFRDNGPVITLDPSKLTTTGTYSVDITITVTGKDLNGNTAIVSKTENLSIVVQSLPDGNLARWISPFEEYNAVVGFSYDRIGNQLYLTWGIGLGADGSPFLRDNNYDPVFANAENLGINGDPLWATLVKPFENLVTSDSVLVGMPMYKTNHTQDWTGFMQTYGVWPNQTLQYPVNKPFTYEYLFNINNTGTYTISAGADNDLQITIFKEPIQSNITPVFSSFSVLYNSYANTQNFSWSATPGQYRIRLNFINQGGPAGIAVRIADENNNVYWSTLNAVRSYVYLYWQEVYRANVTNAGSFYPGRKYLVKNTWPIDINNTDGIVNIETYSAYFANENSGSVPALFKINSDGSGNVTLDWNFSSRNTGKDFYDTTVSGLIYLPFYYSYFSQRKRNIGGGGPETDKLIGFSTNGVTTQRVATPGFGSSTTSFSSFIPGVPSGGRGATSRPGRQYDIYRTNYVDIQGWAPVSSNWYSDETGNFLYSATVPLAFLHPLSTIENYELSNWGFDPSTVSRGRNFTITRLRGNYDYVIELYWTKIKKGETFPGSFGIRPGGTEETSEQLIFTGGDINARARNTFDVTINKRLPDPGLDELIYVVIKDNQLPPGPRGYDNFIIDWTNTIIAPYVDPGGGGYDPGGGPDPVGGEF